MIHNQKFIVRLKDAVLSKHGKPVGLRWLRKWFKDSNQEIPSRKLWGTCDWFDKEIETGVWSN